MLDFVADKALDQGEWQDHQTVPKGQGRWEVRAIWSRTQMNEGGEQDGAGIAQIWLLGRFVRQKEQQREERVAGFTNLPPRL